MSPKIIDHKKRKADIINYSYAFFTKNGIINSSIDSLLSYLNMSKVTFYNYFKTKNELINSIFHELITRYIKLYKYRLKYIKSMEEKFFILFESYLKKSKENEDFLNLYNEYLLFYSSKNEPEINSINTKYLKFVQDVLENTFNENIKAGKIKENSRELIPSISASLDGMLIYSYMIKDFNLQKETKKYLLNLLLIIKKENKWEYV